ncbi:MAG: glycosyltransferase [Phycisphaerales bacterium]|jgi:glycosyltransferase involved in cell wall biosynthesis|nr:glycosyltransferase [Phycisphaerales bacterium]
MKIGIELRPIRMGASGGISMVLKGTLERLFASRPDDQFLVFCTIFNRGLLDHQGTNVRYWSLPIPNFFPAMDNVLRDHPIDALFRSIPMIEGPTLPLSRQAFMVPDIQHELHPEFFTPDILRARRVAYNHVLTQAGAITTLSQFARKTIVDHPWTLCRDVCIVAPALTVEHRPVTEDELSPAERQLIPTNPFFYFPANLWPHKNHRRTLQAFAQFLKRHPDSKMSLLLSGHPKGWEELRREFPNLPMRHLGFVRPELVRMLFQKTTALCFFSQYEGFGIPLLEAFDAGTAVICSNTTSLPEVGGDAVLSCDPTDVSAMANLMGEIHTNPQLRQCLIHKGKQRLGLYTWQDSADNLYAACQRIADAHAQGAIHVQSPPLVSIVTPSYNQGQFLQRTIDSVLSQSYPHVEYLVMDGGSTDQSVPILQSHGQRFQWVSEKDKGQTDAINKGFARSTGSIRAYLNSDDVLEPGAIQKAVDHFQRYPQCDLLYGRANYIDENDRLIGPYRTADYSFDRLMNECIICQPATFWHKRIVDLIGPFDASLHYAMDYDYWLRIDRAGGVIHHTHDTLASSRLYAQTKTLSARPQIYDEIFQICKKHGGRVRLSYFVGLWHHRFKERAGWQKKIGWLPGLYQNVAFLHYRLHHRDWPSPTRTLGRARSWLWNRPSFHAIAGRIGPLGALADRHKRVRGLYADNWMNPHVKIQLRDHAVGHPLRLNGTVPVDLQLTIHSSGATLATFNLAAGQEQFIQFDPPHSQNLTLDLRFSASVIDAANRNLSFLISDTNLFSEEDAFS